MNLYKATVLAFIALLSFSCQKDKDIQPEAHVLPTASIAPKTKDTLKLFVPFAATKQDFSNAEKAFKNSIVSDTQAIRKINGEIILPLSPNKPPIVFKDTHPENDDEAVEYNYTGHINNPDLYLAEGSFWEWHETYLINRTTGNTDTLWSTPVFSPDRKMMVNLSPGYGLEGDPNGFQAWQVHTNNGNATINKLKEVDQQEWIPLNVFWEDNRTLIFKAVTVDVFMAANGEPKDKDFYYFRVKVSR
ncbi:MAG: hypothetical protein V4581_00210 [Bacteroidota bacterium]